MTVSKKEYLDELRAQVTQDERKELEEDEMILISKYNRATMLRLLHDDKIPVGDVDRDRAEGLKAALTAYLNQYMADLPDGHKWIILCCLYLSMIAEEPMHPRQMTGWQRRDDGRYYCRAREDQPGSTCHWCVCRKLSED